MNPPAPGQTAKVCVVCRQDCSDRKRVRDSKGNYMCADCEQAIAARKGAAPRAEPPPRLPNPFLNPEAYDVAPVAPASPTACPSCGTRLQPGAVICMACGHNTSTGKGIATRVMQPKAMGAEPRDRRSLPGPGFLLSPLAVGVGLSVMLPLLFFAGESNESAMLAFFFLGLGVILITALSTIVCAFKDGDAGWGFIGILAVVIPFLGFVTLYYGLVVTERSYLKAFWCANIVAQVLFIVVAVQQ